MKDAADHAKQAMKLMAAREIAPTPKNFTIWCAHAAQSHPDLNRALDILMAGKDIFTESHTDEIFGEFFEMSVAADASGAARQASNTCPSGASSFTHSPVMA